jgi:putative ATP-binding cassette transporter
LVILIALEISGVSFLAIWREWFWNAVEKKELYLFIKYLLEFSAVALALVFVSGYKGFLINTTSLLIRTELTEKALDKIHKIEGYEQRIQEDCKTYPALSLTLLSTFGSNLVQTLVFCGIIIHQSNLHNLFWAVVYTIVGTFIASRIAKPLIQLNYDNQKTEAAFRQDLTLIRYAATYANNMALYVKLKYLQYFQAFFDQITVIIPLLILSPSYFGGMISFGVLMQLSSCISEVINQGSFFVNNFQDINRWIGCKRRLQESKII